LILAVSYARVFILLLIIEISCIDQTLASLLIDMQNKTVDSFHKLEVLRHQLICDGAESVSKVKDFYEFIDGFLGLIFLEVIFLNEKLLKL